MEVSTQMGFDWEMAANVATTVSALLLFSMAVYRYKKTPPLEAMMLEGADKALLQFGMVIEEYLNKSFLLCLKSVVLICLVELSRYKRSLFLCELIFSVIMIALLVPAYFFYEVLCLFDRNKIVKVLENFFKIVIIATLTFIIFPWIIKHIVIPGGISTESFPKTALELSWNSILNFIAILIGIFFKVLFVEIFDWIVLVCWGVEWLKIGQKTKLPELMLISEGSRYFVYGQKDGNLIYGENLKQEYQVNFGIVSLEEIKKKKYMLCTTDKNNTAFEVGKPYFEKKKKEWVNNCRLVMINVNESKCDNLALNPFCWLGDKYVDRENIPFSTMKNRDFEILIECVNRERAEIAAWRLWSWGFNNVKWCVR